jgi:hypothetical protein
MKRPLGRVLTVLFVLAGCAGAARAAPSAVQKELERQYQRLARHSAQRRLMADTTEKPDQPHTLRVAVTARDTWMKTAASWVLRTSEDLLGQTIVDGEPQPVQVAKRAR